jgi:uncharacterized protein
VNSEYLRPFPNNNNHNRHNGQILKVIGEATLQAAPDQAIITLGVHTEHIDPKLAQQENSQTISNIVTTLEELGIGEEHIRTSDYRIDPQYNYVDGKETFKNYRVQHMLQVKTKDIEQVGNIVDSAVKHGANSVSNVRFALANSDSYYNQALTIALGKAYEKALTITRAIEATLHPIPIQIEELSAATPPIVYQATSYVKASTTPIMPGELQITATVRVEYMY